MIASAAHIACSLTAERPAGQSRTIRLYSLRSRLVICWSRRAPHRGRICGNCRKLGSAGITDSPGTLLADIASRGRPSRWKMAAARWRCGSPTPVRNDAPPCGSRSHSKVGRAPVCAQRQASSVASVVLPTPPLMEKTVITAMACDPKWNDPFIGENTSKSNSINCAPQQLRCGDDRGRQPIRSFRATTR